MHLGDVLKTLALLNLPYHVSGNLDDFESR
jgi:hypothetical protein